MSNQNKRNIRLFLEQAYGKEISDTEAEDYKNRFVKFVSLLVEIDQKNKKKGGKFLD